jgi:hypothetical protein
MYKMATEQAENVKQMVTLLQGIDNSLKIMVRNQAAIVDRLDNIEMQLADLEDALKEGKIGELQFANDAIDEDDFEDDFFGIKEDDLDDCDCPSCTASKEVDRVARFKELEEQAFQDLNLLCTTKQLPYRFYGSTLYEYIPNQSKPIQIEVNPAKRTVVALMKDQNGKVVKMGKARCAPDDQFSPYIGGAIAAYRLFEKEVPAYYL